VTLTDCSSIYTNAASETGGGIYKAKGTLGGAVAGRNVYDNTPNNIAH